MFFFRKLKKLKKGIGSHFFHGVYLVNLASEDPEYVQASIDSLIFYQQLAKEIQYAYEHPRELDHMRKNILQFSHPYAAQAIVDQLLA